MAEQKYRVVSRLAAGGMAEVFIGEALSVQGFKKRVAIKRVLPHLASNEGFIGMFLDEARLGARMDHANIVSVFDIGAADNTYFIVMEYVDGCNLKKMIEVQNRRGRPCPVKESIYIAMEACRGLSYAHELLDENEQELDVVHRDISPPNILVSKRGEVKVTDFGLAKASSQLETTDPGVVKGKFSYLSPEAALGEPVDERADIFGLGIVLWEMLAGRRLFMGDSDFATVKLVQKAEIPSLSQINPEVDIEFERVLDKALTKDPNDRYQTAREMGDALAGYLFSHQMKVTSYDIANLVKESMAGEEAPKVAHQQSIIDKLIQEELLRFTSLDEGEEVGSPQVADLLGGADAGAGAKPLDAGLFEDPSSWFADDAEVGAAFDDGAPSNTDSQPGWRESGVEDNLTPLDPDVAAPDVAPVTPAATAEVAPAAPTPAQPAAPANTGGGAGKWIGIGLAVVAIAAAATFFATQQ